MYKSELLLQTLYFSSVSCILSRLDLSQSTYLEALTMKNVVKALCTFVEWLKNGMYQYSSFPFTVKEDVKKSTWEEYIKECESGRFIILQS